MQLYLPDDLYALVKARGLPASELLQNAVRAEVRRLELIEAHRAYVDELVEEVGAPTSAERKKAASIADRIAPRASRKVG